MVPMMLKMVTMMLMMGTIMRMIKWRAGLKRLGSFTARNFSDFTLKLPSLLNTCTVSANQRNFWQNLKLLPFSLNIHLLVVDGEVDNYPEDNEDDDDNDVDVDEDDDDDDELSWS